VTDDDFFKLLASLNKSNLLNRVIVDEAHHLISSKDFRHCFKVMHRLAVFNVPLVFLSATLPSISVNELLRTMHLDPCSVDVIRADTCRKNVKYESIKVDPTELLHQVQVHMAAEEAAFLPLDRGIVFCQTVNTAETLAASAGCQYYVGPLEAAQKPAVASAWQAGKNRWIVATSAFSEGVDYASVRVVIIMEAPRGMLEYDQMAGRVGRDGLPAKVKLFHTKPTTVDNISEPDHMGLIPMHRLLTLTSQCERVERGLFFDGHAHTCHSLPGASHCSRCLGLNVSFFYCPRTHLNLMLLWNRLLRSLRLSPLSRRLKLSPLPHRPPPLLTKACQSRH